METGIGIFVISRDPYSRGFENGTIGSLLDGSLLLKKGTIEISGIPMISKEALISAQVTLSRDFNQGMLGTLLGIPIVSSSMRDP